MSTLRVSGTRNKVSKYGSMEVWRCGGIILHFALEKGVVIWWYGDMVGW